MFKYNNKGDDGMKFMVAVDLEGVACAYGPCDGNVEDSFNIEFVRKQATREADAAVRALFECGAEEVIVWDNHGRGCSLDYDMLDSRCKIAIGSTVGTRYPVLDKTFAGVVMIGYHAMASNSEAVLAHTYSSIKYQYIKVNGTELGEVGIDGAIAGEKGVPVIFVSGDDKCVAEAKGIMPWIETVETKQSFAYTRIVSKHPKAVVEEIYNGVVKAVKRINEMKCFTVKTPVDIEVRYKRTDMATHAKLVDMNGDFFELSDAYTRVGTLVNLEKLLLLL